MSKDDFTCKVCKTVKDSGFILSSKKFKCPNCGWVCDDCVTGGLVFSYKCKKCKKEVIPYVWDSVKQKWKQT